MEISWGIEKKHLRDDDDEYSNIPSAKRHKVYEINHPLIYTIGKEVHFSADIDKLNIEILIKQMSKLIEDFYKDHDDSESLTIKYIVDTPGGSVNSVLKFVDYVKLIKTKYINLEFVSIISGLVASAGTVMCIVADKRYMTTNAHAMIHELSSGNVGRYTQLVSYTDFLKDLHECLINIYMNKTKKTRDELEMLLQKDSWFNANQYLEHNFIDGIK